MAALVKYNVTREHLGDDVVIGEGGVQDIVAKRFVVGDTRTADPTVVAQLVMNGVLVASDGEKAEPGHQTKVDPKPKNKGEAADKAAADKAAADKAAADKAAADKAGE